MGVSGCCYISSNPSPYIEFDPTGTSGGSGSDGKSYLYMGAASRGDDSNEPRCRTRSVDSW